MRRKSTHILYCMVVTSLSFGDLYSIAMSRSRLFFVFGAHVMRPAILSPSEMVIVVGV